MNNNLNLSVSSSSNRVADVDYNELLRKRFGGGLPANDIRRVVVRMTAVYTKECMPSFIDSLGDLRGIEPSTLGLVDCGAILAAYQKEHIADTHPRNTVEALTDTHDVFVSDTGIKYVKDGKDVIIPAVMGMVAVKEIDLIIGASVSLLNSYTSEKDGYLVEMLNEPKYANITQIPAQSLCADREVLRTFKNSASESIGIQYSLLKRNHKFAVSVINGMYKKFKEYAVSNSIIADAGTKYMKSVGLNVICEGYIPCSVQRSVVVKKVSCEQMWKILNISLSYRGGDKGRGAITCSYYNYDMTTSLVKSCGRARELLGLMKLIHLSILKITDDKITLLTKRILVANGVSIIGDDGTGECVDGAKAGYYRWTKSSYLLVKKNNLLSPVYDKNGITFMPDFNQAFEDNLRNLKRITVMYTYLTPGISDQIAAGKCAIYPTMAGHSGRIWCIYGPNTVGFDFVKFDDMVARNLEMCISKNIFMLTRSPYYAKDKCRLFFSENIVIPKVIRKEKATNLDLFDVCEYVGETLKVGIAIPEDIDLVEVIPMSEDQRLSILCASLVNSLNLLRSYDDIFDFLSLRYVRKDVEWACIVSMIAGKDGRLSDQVYACYLAIVENRQVPGLVMPLSQNLSPPLPHQGYKDNDALPDLDDDSLNDLMGATTVKKHDKKKKE